MVLKPAEIRAVLGALPSTDFRLIVRMLLLTGECWDEIANLSWPEGDLTGALHLPAEQTKNRLAHDVPLARRALSLLAALPRTERRDYVFGSGVGRFQGFARARAALGKASSVTGWRLLDLRRTVATGMGGLGVLPHVVEAV